MLLGPAPTPPGETNHHCGISIGYQATMSVDAIYFGFVDCSGRVTGNFNTHVHKLSAAGGLEYNKAIIVNRAANGEWTFVANQLYNTGHHNPSGRECLIQRVSDTFYPDVACFAEPQFGNEVLEPNWGHATFANGFYFSDFDGSGQNRATPWRVVQVGQGFQRQAIGGVEQTLQSATFLNDTERNQLFLFRSLAGGTVEVWCSTDGWNFQLKDWAGPLLGVYGPTGSVATVWHNPTSVVWGHTKTASNNAPSRALVLRSTGSCR